MIPAEEHACAFFIPSLQVSPDGARLGAAKISFMRAYQLFQYLSPELAAGIVRDMQTEQREGYRAALAKLAEQKRLRPVFVQRKSREDQARWMSTQLGLKTADEVAESLLQVWLVKCQQDLIVTFLDNAGISHDGEGSIEDLPDKIEEDKLDAAINACLKTHPPEIVALYLRVFQLQQGNGWPEIARVLETDERLRLGRQPAPESASAEEASAATDESASAGAATKKSPSKKKSTAKKAVKKATKKKSATTKSAD